MKDSIGFIGVGAMGGGMAACIAKAGYPLTVYDTNPKALQPLRALGATVAESPRAVADAAAIVFACLPSPAVSEAVAKEVAGGKAIKVYVETSTIGTDCMKAVADTLAPSGIVLMDGPISGGPANAAKGVLSTIVSGDTAVYERLRPVIDCFAQHVFFLGGTPGQAQVAKLINNMMSMASRAVAIEGAIMGMKVGIDPVLLADFINVSTGRNMATLDQFPTRLLNVFESGGKKSIGTKDLELYLKEAGRLDAPVWGTPRFLDLFVAGEAYDVSPPEQLPLKPWVDRLKAIRDARK